MGCCKSKKWLKLLAGLVIILVSMRVLWYDVWIIVGLYLALAGIMPMVCPCEHCNGSMMGKKKR